MATLLLKKIGIPLVAMCFCFLQATPLSQAADYDSGPINLIVDDTVYIDGNNGVYAVELLGMCTWCEEGIEVLIKFLGFTKATIQPYRAPDDAAIFKPVRCLLVRDARYEN